MREPWMVELTERYGRVPTAGIELSKASTLASSPADIKAVNEAMATSGIYGGGNVGYSSSSTVSSVLSVSSGC
ncbi:hypothetical protein H4R20_003536 [Coemansia guatemalensis]|uniref:Uncharacterized protein n=1 Tax=Coemansia guatemalensis TaxID=2761395 RepID=A0A9W8LRA9_9FUNG|nr:hypothetical protein H4R20_003536 [Coemansia guatemalensis]